MTVRSRLRGAAAALLRADVRLLGGFESLLLRHRPDADPSSPQLFILGLPRTGTTLVYQYIVHRLRVAYFTNGCGRYHRSPCLVTRIQRALHGEYVSDFESAYGKVEGPMAPREAGSVWARFFGFEPYVEAGDVASGDRETLRRTVHCVQRTFGGAPFVNKNVKHVLRIPALAAIFPRARFLVVERGRGDVALSVLRGRYRQVGDPERWWSVRPPDYEEIRRLGPVEQVARQLDSLERKLDADLRGLAPERVLRCRYEAFCRDPEEVADVVRDALGGPGDRNPPASSFRVSRNEPRTDEERKLVERVAGRD